MASASAYQVGLLADTIQKATIQGLLDPEEAEILQEHLEEVDSLEEAHEL
ncbi:hypothetical protein [Haloarcula nitratireducens]|uniref:Uncharacterized protein n=1 Tax=Haloarcula nitratireducens TaxID=2487749 RepID=A0AAW4PJ23_9EURY|nr:hypothetical protein [Halomicroarcula nitratireducens]MBX0298035.1 hypothetical protein [Halomicroarcula nitratireducens]